MMTGNGKWWGVMVSDRDKCQMMVDDWILR